MKPQGIIFHTPSSLDDLDKQKEGLNAKLVKLCDKKSTLKKMVELFCLGAGDKDQAVKMMEQKIYNVVGLLRHSENINFVQKSIIEFFVDEPLPRDEYFYFQEIKMDTVIDYED